MLLENFRRFSWMLTQWGIRSTVSFSLVACANILSRPQLDPAVFYQKDITFHVSFIQPDGKWSPKYQITGAGVMPEAASYKITVFPSGKADMITVSSCHREEKNANPPKDSWYSEGYTFQIDLVTGLESKKSCPIDIGVYERVAGRHGWALLAINSGREKLPAVTKCNGRVKQYTGVSVCQAKKGLIQKYEFKTPVAVASSGGCEITEAKDQMNWEFPIPRGQCTVYFIDKKNPDNFHQANLFGFDTIPIRGIK